MPDRGAEVAHHYRHPALPDVDLLRARFVKHRYNRHTHDGYVFGVIEAGVEEFELGSAGGRRRRGGRPPSLEQLAKAVGTRPFPLLRAFRDTVGLPPHAYLNQVRVPAARTLLDEGLPRPTSRRARSSPTRPT